MEGLEAKLDTALETLERLERKVDGLDERLSKMESKYDEKQEEKIRQQKFADHEALKEGRSQFATSQKLALKTSTAPSHPIGIKPNQDVKPFRRDDHNPPTDPSSSARYRPNQPPPRSFG